MCDIFSQRSELVKCQSQPIITRKLSEPYLGSSYSGWDKNSRFRSSDNAPGVRRAKSFFESSNRLSSTRSGTFLGQRTLEECKKVDYTLHILPELMHPYQQKWRYF